MHGEVLAVAQIIPVSLHGQPHEATCAWRRFTLLFWAGKADDGAQLAPGDFVQVNNPG
jgi:hypothetical protein